MVLGQVRPAVRSKGANLRDGERQLGPERRVLDLENKITLLKKQIAYGVTRVERRRAELAKTRELLRLGAATESQVLRAEDNLKEAEYDQTILETKLENQTRLLEMYRQTYLLTSADGHPEVSLPVGYEGLLYAPEDGIVANIYKHKGEVVRTGEPVLKIIHPAKSFIKTYFRGTFERSLAVGDQARIVFENGEESEGVIQKIYRTAFSQPPEFKNRFGSMQRYIIAEVVPKDPVYWDRILETRAKVLVRKRWFFWQKSKPTQELQQARKKS
ncbi:MAG: HlyD family efflux transporter periplasmic adaptor subunit [Calditrichaeota bacterium]|nr:MAG: HlyD family efflux transporter periplasmic adaptor subunit [Calditrichota bacterium]